MKRTKTRLEVINNESDPEVTELYLYGRIGEPVSEDEETITVKDVREKLKEINTDKIIVHLNSGGGCLFSSVAIHNLLKSHKANIEIVIDSRAASGGSVIAMAGDKIKMYSNSMLFIHPAHTLTYASAKGHRKVADDLDKIDKSLKENYKKRFIGTEEELEDLIQNETWLDAEEAKELGFCDEIIDEDNGVSNSTNNVTIFTKLAQNQPSKVKQNLLMKYSNKGNKNLLDNFKSDSKVSKNLLSKISERGK